MMWVKLPVRFVKEGQPDFQELGINIKPDVEPGEMLINMDYVNSINESDSGEETILRFDGVTGDNCIWVQKPYQFFVDLLIDGKK